MYASLIATGVTSLLDLFKSQSKSTSSTTSTSFDPAASTDQGATPSIGTGTSGGLSSSLNNLLLDLQSSRTGATDQTQAVTNDLKTVFHEAKGLGHGHHPHAGAVPSTGSTSGTTNPLQSLATSLLAYTKAQNTTAVGSTGGLALTA